MIKIRYWIRLLWAFLFRFKLVLGISILLGALAFVVINTLNPFLSRPKTQRIAIAGRFTTTDLPSSILHLIGNGLTKLDENGIPKPGIAKSWEPLDGGKSWKFTIDTSLHWQDGSAVTADTIKYQFEDVTQENLDKSNILYKLQNPFAPFPVIVSKSIFKSGLLGTGEWEVSAISFAGNFIEKLDLKNKNGERRAYKFYPNEEGAKIAFQLGEVDIIEDLIDPKPFDKWKTVSLSKTTNVKRFVSVFFNVEDEILADKKIRQALSYAIDKKKFGESRAITPISPTSWAYNPQVKTYDFDQKRAQELINESELSKEKKASLSIKLVTTPLLLDTAENIARDWDKVGIKTTVLVSPILPDEYQAFLAMYDIPSDPDQYSTWHSTQGETNITGYQNPRIDKLLEEGRQEIDFSKRQKIYFDFQRFLLEDAPAIFLYYPTAYTLNRK